MNKWIKILAIGLLMLFLAGCGERVSVGAAELGKVMSETGYQENVISTSTFRLDSCWQPGAVCQKLVTLDVSDRSVTEQFSLYMPKDKLKMDFTVGLTVGINENRVEQLFNRIPPTKVDDQLMNISFAQGYKTYARRIINAETRGFLTQYSILEISDNRDVIGAKLFEHLKSRVEESTPFIIQYAGLDDVDYPSVILQAEEDAAKRTIAVRREEAELEVSKVKLERERQEQKMQRVIDVERAEAEAQVNRILAESMTDEYERYRMLDALDFISKSDNTIVLPFEMLSTIGSQTALGNIVSK